MLVVAVVVVVVGLVIEVVVVVLVVLLLVLQSTSSLPSAQSLSPLQTHAPSIHLSLLEHRNSVGLQDTVSKDNLQTNKLSLRLFCLL